MVKLRVKECSGLLVKLNVYMTVLWESKGKVNFSLTTMLAVTARY